MVYSEVGITNYAKDNKLTGLQLVLLLPKYYSSLDGPRRGDIQLSGVHDLKSAQVEEDINVDHEYEAIEKYTHMPHTLPSLPVPTSSSPPLPADIGDCIIDSCPAYGITTQGQSTSDEDPEAHYSVVDVQ